MKIFLFGELNADNIKRICPMAEISETEAVVQGYRMRCNSNGRSYLEESTSSVSGFMAECSAKDTWRLDQWKDLLLLYRKEISDGVQAYFSIYKEDGDQGQLASNEEIEAFALERESFTGLRYADLHLLIPGYCSELVVDEREYSFLGTVLQQRIQEATEAEFNSDFLKDTTRVGLGNIGIVTQNGYVQNGVLTFMYHNRTGLGVADIFIPSAIASTHGILASFCGDSIELIYRSERMNLRGLCERIGFRQYGSRRSMVFSYEDLSREQLLNVLVNEEFPMGKIMGDHFIDIINTNMAQYDTARVYVSEATMIEISDNIPKRLFDRIDSQAVEIFFVEMLLLQDAAVSKMYDCVQEEIEKERTSPFRKDSGKVFEKLLEDSSYALSFTDYQQFYFPTVRVSAQRIAQAFGINAIREKYARSKEILENMIDRHNAELAKQVDRIENSLLLLLAVLSGIEPLQMGFSLILKSEAAAYFASIAILAGLSLSYMGLKIAKRRRLRYGTRSKKGTGVSDKKGKER